MLGGEAGTVYSCAGCHTRGPGQYRSPLGRPLREPIKGGVGQHTDMHTDSAAFGFQARLFSTAFGCKLRYNGGSDPSFIFRDILFISL